MTVTLRGGEKEEWSSSATFLSGADGVVDLGRMAPASGSYRGVEADGAFLVRATRSKCAARHSRGRKNPPPQTWQIAAQVDKAIVAETTVSRRAVAADVTVTMVRENGLVGAFYQPPGEGRHPAVIVLSGREADCRRHTSQAGGLASRGYAVLALAYFAAEGLPPSLSQIPLENFGTALDWLAAQPSVDASRIGVLGTSRGGELALLLGSVYPRDQERRGVCAEQCCVGRPPRQNQRAVVDDRGPASRLGQSCGCVILPRCSGPRSASRKSEARCF